MSVSERASSTANALHRVATGVSLLLGTVLLLGALGHLGAVWPDLKLVLQPGAAESRALLWPGLILLVGSALNGGLAIGLWQGRTGATSLALAGNLALAGYLFLLLLQGLPGHPIGVFLALVCSQLIVLVAIRCGLALNPGN